MDDRTDGRWNPREPLNITPEDYEKQVIEWLRSAEVGSLNIRVAHQERSYGSGGEYTLDGRADFEIFGGAKISCLVECKKHLRPIDRDVVLGVHAKMMDLGFQKAIIVSTSGFQAGAIRYATAKGIALIMFVDGKAIYHTRSAEQSKPAQLPPWVPKFAGQMISGSENSFQLWTIDESRAEPIRAWLRI
jgi:restriction system protein